MHYLLRVVVPDRPGALGAVALRLGEASVDIAALDVVDRAEGIAVDDIRVTTDLRAAPLRAVFEDVPGVVVEALDEVPAASGVNTATGLAAAIAECGSDPVTCLVEGLPGAMSSAWAVAVADGPAGLEVRAASEQAPGVPAGLRLPFLPLAGPRRLPPAQWMPRDWACAGRLPEMAVAALGGPSDAVLLARPGPRFRAAERRRLSELARVAVATAERSVLLTLPR